MTNHRGIIQLAEKVAKKIHEGQKYGEEFPYYVHLQSTVAIGIRFGVTDYRLICALWLHDTIEDGKAPVEEIIDDLRMYFGSEILSIIMPLSEPRTGTRKERHAIAYPNIQKNVKSIFVKLCDRLSHVESGGKKISMYKKEHAEFKRYFRDVPMPDELKDIVEAMWTRLDDLIVDISVTV